jgi:hypothetical protein
MKVKKKSHVLAWNKERVLPEEVGKLLGMYRSSLNRLMAKAKNFSIPRQTVLRMGRKNGKRCEKLFLRGRS